MIPGTEEGAYKDIWLLLLSTYPFRIKRRLCLPSTCCCSNKYNFLHPSPRASQCVHALGPALQYPHTGYSLGGQSCSPAPSCTHTQCFPCQALCMGWTPGTIKLSPGGCSLLHQLPGHAVQAASLGQFLLLTAPGCRALGWTLQPSSLYWANRVATNKGWVAGRPGPSSAPIPCVSSRSWDGARSHGQDPCSHPYAPSRNGWSDL